MADKGKRWAPKAESKAEFKPGGRKGKLHRELGVPKGEKIPAKRLAAAEKSSDPEIKRDAERAKTMEGWRKPAGERRKTLYDKSK